MSTLKVTNITPQSGSNVHLTGSLIVSETLIAKEVRTELTQSVVLFQSGSTKFGDTSDDTHVFTGSLNITGSTIQLGEIDIKGKSNKVRFHFDTLADLPSAVDYHGMFAHVHAEGAAYFAHGGNWVELANSSSFAAHLSTVDGEIDALQTDSGSFSTRVTTNETEIDALQTDSGSFSTRVTTNETEIDALQTDSGSFSTRITTNESEIDALQTNSASFSTRVTTNETDISDLQSFSSSLDSTYATDAQVLAQTASLSSSLATDIATNVTNIATSVSDITSLTEATASYASTGSNTFIGETIISSSQLLTLQPIDPAPVAASTGSLIVSGSPAVLYIWNGSWSAV